MAWVTAAVVIGGCSFGEILADYGDPVDLRSSDVVGTWQGKADDGAERTITFTGDGRFDAGNLPIEAFDLPPSEARSVVRLDGSGTWEVGSPDQNAEGPECEVQLEFHRLNGRDDLVLGPDLTALRQDNVVGLILFYDGAGGNSWTSYARQP